MIACTTSKMHARGAGMNFGNWRFRSCLKEFFSSWGEVRFYVTNKHTFFSYLTVIALKIDVSSSKTWVEHCFLSGFAVCP